ATALQWVLRRRVGSGPMQSSVKCAGNVKMPDTTEGVCRGVARRYRTVEGNRCATDISCYCRRESNVFQAVNRTYVIDVLPGLTAIGGCGDDCIRTASRAAGYCAAGHRKINFAVIVNSYCWILNVGVGTRLRACVLDGTYIPRQAVIF